MTLKNLKPIALLVLALAIGLAAALSAAGWLQQQGSLSAQRIVVAAVDIDSGSRLAPPMTTVVDWPSGSVPEGAFTDPAALADRVVKVGLVRGEPLVARKLAPVGTQGGLSAVIAPGKRAMTVRVNDVVGVAGFALPGNHVDVVVNATQDRGRSEMPLPTSMTVLEQVLVLAVAQEASRDDTKPKVVNAVTLEVTPAEAEKLDLARSVGTLSLVLRNQMDRQSVTTAGITKGELFGGRRDLHPALAEAPAQPVAPMVRRADVQRVKAPAAPKSCVEVIHSERRARECF
jgi:pilus assembly protein CpaB